MASSSLIKRHHALAVSPRRWLVTGVAGFIGSHLLETLLRLDQEVVGLDNFSTGKPDNLTDVCRSVGSERWARFSFREGDVTRLADVEAAVDDCNLVLHQAALGSVPQSFEDPVGTHASNVTGFLHVLQAARAARADRVVYASSSAVYGDCAELPAREDRIGRPLSPYALSKSMDEQYAGVFESCFGFPSIGLRYFNVCGPRQDPDGAYAAVIPRWIAALFDSRTVEIYGDGETSRDFCPVANVVHANLLAATAPLTPQNPRVFNVGLGTATSLNTLFATLRDAVARHDPSLALVAASYGAFRVGDVRHSRADLTAIARGLGYGEVVTLAQGLQETVDWFASRRTASNASRCPLPPTPSSSCPSHPEASRT